MIAVLVFSLAIIGKIYILCKPTVEIQLHLPWFKKVFGCIWLCFCLSCVAMLLIQYLYYDVTLTTVTWELNSIDLFLMFCLQLQVWIAAIMTSYFVITCLFHCIRDKCCRQKEWKFGQNLSQRAPAALSRLSRAFDPFRFSEHSECAICLMNFERDELVTALPCDYRHYFHTHCILNWSEKQSACPLCKKYFAMSSIQDFNNRLTIETDRQRHEMGLAPV